MKISILFIINPISGSKKGANLETRIRQLIDADKFNIEIALTQYKGHAYTIAREAVSRGVQIIVAAGGDGTINEIATALVYSESKLAILPIGSGNGLARHLKLPHRVDNAIKFINDNADKAEAIDVGKANDSYFFSIAGVGYDAKVAYDFNNGTKRNFLGYFIQIVKNYFKFQSENYLLDYGDKREAKRAFFITFANSSQWGYNVKIKPAASLKDGKLDIIIAEKPKFISLFYLVILLFMGKIEHSKIIESLQQQAVTVTSKDANLLYLHIDGDAVGTVPTVKISLLPQALKVLI
ncbi:MAG TPA: diacylglycerol kinase family lipid kinase [Bacteroidales bacterium]|nr:diacylglycerol kinase family lipid kinase [Bacteroidales bacterium]